MIEPKTLLRALSDTTRLRICMLLLAHDELCVCELTGALDLAQPKVSRHLAILREAQVVRDRRTGLWIHYRIHPQLPEWALDVLQGLRHGCEGEDPYVADEARLKTVDVERRACSA